MAASLTNFFSYSSPSSSLHCSGHRRTSLLSYSLFRQSGIPAPTAGRSLRCFSSDGRRRGGDAEDSAAKEAERISEEKRRSDLAARIASGEFTVPKSGKRLVSMLRTGLSKIGPGGKFLGEVLVRLGGGDDDGECLEIPQAKGSLKAVGEQAFFIPLYDLHLIYGGIFRLSFGPKSFLIVSDPEMAKHILKDNCKAYSKGILAEILDFVMGKGLIPANGEVWRVRRRAIVPALHMKDTRKVETIGASLLRVFPLGAFDSSSKAFIIPIL